MGCTTHSYGLYNPQLWVVEFVLTIGKIFPHGQENIGARLGKHRLAREAISTCFELLLILSAL